MTLPIGLQDAEKSVTLDGTTNAFTPMQCPVCGEYKVASNGSALWCTACEWHGTVIKHKPRRREERVQDEW